MDNRTYYSSLLQKTDDELIRILSHYWGVSIEDLNKPFKVIATYKKAPKKDIKGREYGYFENVHNLNGDILYYPHKLGKVRVFSLHRDSFLTNEFWQVNVKLASRIQRIKFNHPFMLEISDTFLDEPKLSFVDKLNKEKLIRKIFEETGSTSRDAKNTSNALHAIMGDLYTESERFIFELLQNADDQPQEGSLVNVTLKTLNEDLLFLHSGKPFSVADVESISSIGDSTKKNDSEKQAIKVSDSNLFFLKQKLYTSIPAIFHLHLTRNHPSILTKKTWIQFHGKSNLFGKKDIVFPKRYKRNLCFSAPVGIALNVDHQNIIKYDKIITTLLSKPRFALFLRNIGHIRFESTKGDVIEIQKSINGNTVRLSSNEITEDWIIKDYTIRIPEETQEALQNEKLVPKKLKEATKTKITFAAKIIEGKVVPVQDAVLFTYLPTKVNDFGFKFLVNADFLTTASRESIHFKNTWNRFLFGQIGALLVDWVKSLADYDGALCLLPKEKYDGDNLLTLDFYNSFQKSASELDFIKGQNGNLITQDRIMIDKSGLSKIIGKDLFCSIIDPNKHLPYFDSDEDALKESKLYDSVYRVTTLTVLNAIYNNASFLNWFKDASEDSKESFYDWLINKDTEKSRGSIVRVCENLPLYKFSDKYYFKNEIKATQIVVRKGHAKLVPLYKAIGLDCSTNIDELPIAKFYSDKIVVASFEYIFKHLRENDNFSKLIISENVTDIKILTEWLDEQDRSTQKHDIIVNFIESLPILIFNKEILKRSDIVHTQKKPIYRNNILVGIINEETLDKTRIITTNKLSGVVDLLSKIGLFCSNNIEDTPFSKYFRLPKETDVYNVICEKANFALTENINVLNPLEKVTLFRVMKNLNCAEKVDLSHNLLFCNQAGTHRRRLSSMTVYSPNLPQWMHEYTISEKESFPDLEPYLVKRERIFDDIIKPNIKELSNSISLKEMYLFYKGTWTMDFSKNLIDKFGITEAIVEMVEVLGVESKKYLLQKLQKIDIDLSKVYNSEDLVSKIIRIALEVYNDDEIRLLTNKIYVGERTVSSYTISDNITLEYHDGKSLSIPLSKLLPEYEEPDMISKIKHSLSNFSDSELTKLLCLQPMGAADVWDRCDKGKGYTPYLYLLGIYYARKIRGWYNTWVPNIILASLPDSWVHTLLNIMFDQQIKLYNDSFGYRLSKYFRGYFKNEYVNEDETILSSIESWADTDQKKSYLISLGVKTDQSNLITFRKNLIENKPIEAIDIEKQKEQIVSTVNYLKNKNKLPLVGESQVAALRQFVAYDRYLSAIVDLSMLQEKSIEYDLHEYYLWKMIIQ